MKSFIRGGRYRHESTLDVDILVEKVQYTGPTYMKLKVWYLNRNLNDMLIFPSTETVKVQNRDIHKWERIV